MTLDAAAGSLSRSCDQEAGLVVVFDDSCSFCNGWAQFVIKRDRKRSFQFASAQSEKGTAILAALKFPVQTLETIILIDGRQHYEKSDAVLQILKRLGGLWLASQVFMFVPKHLRDACYTAFARRRYGWFGKSDVCRLSDVKWRDDVVSRNDSSDSSPRVTMQLSIAELARLEQMVASCQVRSDPTMLSTTDQRMDAMLHAASRGKKASMDSHHIANNLRAAEDIAHDADPTQLASDHPAGDPDSEKVSRNSEGAGDRPHWNPARTLEELIQIRRSLMRNEGPSL
jgi:predicted DCC family thiol-disulfide oxidoreductase YuxK